MDLSASYTFEAPRPAVWAALIDPTVVSGCLPGCESMEPTGEDSYRAVLNVGVAAITGRYEGTVTLADQEPPARCRLVVDGSGRAGFVKGEALVELSEAGEGQTLVTVSGRGQVGGLMARVGQRLLGSVSKTMMDKFFDCLSRKVTS